MPNVETEVVIPKEIVYLLRNMNIPVYGSGNIDNIFKQHMDYRTSTENLSTKIKKGIDYDPYRLKFDYSDTFQRELTQKIDNSTNVSGKTFFHYDTTNGRIMLSNIEEEAAENVFISNNRIYYKYKKNDNDVVYKIRTDINSEFMKCSITDINNQSSPVLTYKLPYLMNNKQLIDYNLVSTRFDSIKRNDFFCETVLTGTGFQGKLENHIKYLNGVQQIGIIEIIQNNMFTMMNVFNNYASTIYDYILKKEEMATAMEADFIGSINNMIDKYSRFQLEVASVYIDMLNVLKGANVQLRPLTERQKAISAISAGMSTALQFYGSTGKPEIAIPLALLTTVGMYMRYK